MNALRKYPNLTEAEYLALDAESDIRYEYIRGEVYAMTGAKQPHVKITSTLQGLLFNALRGKPCTSYVLDMRVFVEPANSYSYPDITVVCGEEKYKEDATIATLLNPTLLIEVLSPTTEIKDRGVKFDDYQQLPSLQDYVLIAQHIPKVECFSRGENGTWILTTSRGLGGSLLLPSIDHTLQLSEVYEEVNFDES